MENVRVETPLVEREGDLYVSACRVFAFVGISLVLHFMQGLGLFRWAAFGLRHPYFFSLPSEPSKMIC